LTKAVSNYYAGAFANKIGRKNLLLIGWIVGAPVPLMLMFAPSWGWVIAANVLLGINQGLAWSSTVVMKIDLVGEKQRGLAMGFNESAGYMAVGLVAFLTGWLASEYGLRPVPFYLGIGFIVAGFFLTLLFVKDTAGHVQAETKSSTQPLLSNIFRETTFKHPNLGSITQAGLINNLNDGMIWGIFPLLLASKGFSIQEIAPLVAIYPAVWGLGQLFTGAAADKQPKKQILFWGMLGQAIAIAGFPLASTFSSMTLLSVVLGLGTAAVYPTFLAAIADNTHPQQRASSIGIFRLWRDLGYVFGAVLTGILADAISMAIAIYTIAGLTLFSSIFIKLRMKTN
jgi:MFS family permease